MFSVEMLHADSLDEATTLVASEHAAALALNPAIPADAGDPERCRRALAGLLADGHRGFHSVSVDFMPANPLSRPFWLGAGFTPTGYGVARTIQIP
jgi:hypothetical protein